MQAGVEEGSFRRKLLIINTIDFIIMNRKIVLRSVFAIVAAGFVLSVSSCKKDVAAPTNLSVANITETTVSLMWEGTADSYEILLTSQSAADISFSSTTIFCVVTNLTENTLYAWKVRAKRGDDYSEWVKGTSFTTAKGTSEVHEIVGAWRYEKSEIKEIVCDDPLTAAMIQVAFQTYGIDEMIEEIFGGRYEFTTDGNVKHWTDSGTDEGSYTVNENKLTITNSENLSSTFDFSIVNNKMYLDFDLLEMTDIAAKYELDTYLDILLSMGVTKCVLRMTYTKELGITNKQ